MLSHAQVTVAISLTCTLTPFGTGSAHSVTLSTEAGIPVVFEYLDLLPDTRYKITLSPPHFSHLLPATGWLRTLPRRPQVPVTRYVVELNNVSPSKCCSPGITAKVLSILALSGNVLDGLLGRTDESSKSTWAQAGDVLQAVTLTA